MLLNVLKALARGGTVSVNEIAAQMGIAPKLAQQVVEDLGRMGFLAANEPMCAAYCTCCPMNGNCSLRLRPRMWTLTTKAREYLARTAPGRS